MPDKRRETMVPASTFFFPWPAFLFSGGVAGEVEVAETPELHVHLSLDARVSLCCRGKRSGR
jgi:hypothetical protein